MPNGASGPSAPYSYSFSDDATAARKTLPAEVQCALFDIVHELAADPGKFPERIRPLAHDLAIYTHPNPPFEITYELHRDKRCLVLHHFVVPAFQAVKPVFISYCHEDAEWLQKVKKFLKPLEDKGLIHVWDDSDIKPGQQWLPEIRKALDSASAAVLLVSQDFLCSEFITHEELPALLEAARNRGAALLWVPIKFSTYGDYPVLSKLQAAQDPAHPLEALPESQQNKVLVEICNKVKQAVETRPVN
jgi:hypothetical protein